MHNDIHTAQKMWPILIQSADEQKQQTWSPGEKRQVECVARHAGPHEVSDMWPNHQSLSLVV